MRASVRCVALCDVVPRHNAERHADVAAGALKQVVQHVLAARRARAHARGGFVLCLVPLAQNGFYVLALLFGQLSFVLGLLPKLSRP